MARLSKAAKDEACKAGRDELFKCPQFFVSAWRNRIGRAIFPYLLQGELIEKGARVRVIAPLELKWQLERLWQDVEISSQLVAFANGLTIDRIKIPRRLTPDEIMELIPEFIPGVQDPPSVSKTLRTLGL